MENIYILIAIIVALLIIKKIFFGKKEKVSICKKCNHKHRGIPDEYPYCGGCLERMRDRADSKTASKMTKALKKRGEWFMKSEGM